MKNLLYIIVLIFVYTANSIEWRKLEINESNLQIEGGFEQFVNNQEILYGLKNNMLYSNSENINELNPSDLIKDLEGVSIVLAVNYFEPELYVLVLNDDNSQQLLSFKIKSNELDYELTKYDKFEFSGDSVFIPNRLLKVTESVIIAYSVEEKKSLYYQAHILPNDFGDYYEVRVILPPEGIYEEAFRTITDSELKSLSNKGIEKCRYGFLSDSLIVFNIIERNGNPFEIDYQYSITPQLNNIDVFTYLDSAFFPFSFIENGFMFEPDNYELHAVEHSIDLNSREKITILRKIFKNPAPPKRHKTHFRVLELEYGGKFISDFYKIKDRIIFLYKYEDEVRLYYSDDSSNTWDYFPAPEFKEENKVEFHSYRNTLYAYNENSVYIADAFSSVKTLNSEQSIFCYFNNSELVVNSETDNIIKVELIDLLGNILISKEIASKMNVSIPVNLPNYNLFLCRVTTNNGVDVKKIFKE